MFKYIIDEDLELRLIRMQDSNKFYKLIDSNRTHLREWVPWVNGTKYVKDTQSFIV